MTIPMVDLVTQYQSLQSVIAPALAQTLQNAQFILGPNVQAFEKEAAQYLGVPHAVAVANGTDALHLALLAAGIGPGDEVITPPFTFIATAEAIAYVGAKAVFVDIDPATYNLDPQAVERAITPRTRAILPVHLFGQPAEMGALLALAKAHQLRLIEDCAQSFGAETLGRKTGALGDIAANSFFPSKNLGCYGDGGMVTTANDEMAERLRMLRNHGSKVRYYHDIIGYNSRLDEIQAVVLRAKLPHIDTYNRERRRVAHRYNAGLRGLPVVTPHEDARGLHVYHQYTILLDDRAKVEAALKAAQIACAIYYPVPLHKQAVFAEISQGVSCPVSESVAERCLSLPIYPELANEQVDQICAVIRAALQA